MKKIFLDQIVLDGYDDKYKDYINDFKEGKSFSKYIHNIKERIELTKYKEEFSLECGYIVLNKNLIPIGYVFLSNIKRDEIYVEYSVLNNERRKGYGKLILSEVSDFLAQNYNIKQINLDIDPSNEASIKTAESCGFTFDEESFENNNYMGKMLFYKENIFYIKKSKR